MFEFEFMRLAFATGAIVGVLAPAVGFFLVQRRMSLIGDGIGHVAFAGVAAGYLLGVSPVLTALGASIAGAVGIEWLRASRRAAGERARLAATSSRRRDRGGRSRHGRVTLRPRRRARTGSR